MREQYLSAEFKKVVMYPTIPNEEEDNDHFDPNVVTCTV